jgi:hypothetical protein
MPKMIKKQLELLIYQRSQLIIILLGVGKSILYLDWAGEV